MLSPNEAEQFLPIPETEILSSDHKDDMVLFQLGLDLEEVVRNERPRVSLYRMSSDEER